MKFPPFLLAAILLFWGWQNHLLSFAIVMALILESAHWIKWRWQLSDKEINRVADVTSFVLFFIMLYLFNRQGTQGIFTLLSFLPMLLFFLIFVQSYHVQNAVKLSALFITLRTNDISGNYWVDLRYPYIIICLLAASVGQNEWFFSGSYLLIIWGLWLTRSYRYAITLWLGLIINFGIFAYFGQIGIHQLQIKTEQWVISWLEEFLSINRDPYRQHTAIGDIGILKQSDKIMWRVASKQPLLLREAIYNTYFRDTWYAKQTNFTPLFVQPDQTTWILTPHSPLPNQSEQVQIIGYLPQGKGLLPLSIGSYQVTHLPAIRMQHNELGTIKVEEAPDFVDYHVAKSDTLSLETPPTSQDLFVPTEEQSHLQTLVAQLRLAKKTPQEAISHLNQYINKNFTYSLTLPTPIDDSTPLQYFLQQAHYGHCEYFATATVLLLRQAHIPARYAVGYAVDEYSFWEDIYVVRRRHAHAWALVYLNGRWLEVDNTPAIWRTLEEEQASWWQSISDLWSWLNLRFTQWRWQQSDANHERLLIGLIVFLILILFWRLYFKERIHQTAHSKKTQRKDKILPGADSPFYQITQQITISGYAHRPGETLTKWLQRASIAHCLTATEMQHLLQLHQRYRFDPHGINVAELKLLQILVEKWSKQFTNKVV